MRTFYLEDWVSISVFDSNFDVNLSGHLFFGSLTNLHTWTLDRFEIARSISFDAKPAIRSNKAQIISTSR